MFDFKKCLLLIFNMFFQIATLSQCVGLQIIFNVKVKMQQGMKKLSNRTVIIILKFCCNCVAMHKV